MVRFSQGLLILLLTLAGTADVSAQVRLEPKLTPNQSWTTENQVKTDQVLTLAGMDLETAGRQAFRLRSSAGPASADGQVRVQNHFEQLQATLALPGGIQLEFDSARPDAPAAGGPADVILELLKAMAKASWTVVYGADGRAVGVEGEQDILESLSQELRPVLERQFQEEYLIEQANNELDKLPSGPVGMGETWQRTFTARLDGGQNLTITTRYEYVGPVVRDGVTLDQISSRGVEVRYSIDQDAPTPLRVSSSDLKIAESDGIFFFDRARGQIVESRDKLNIVGDINFVIGGMPQPGKLDLTIETNSKRL